MALTYVLKILALPRRGQQIVTDTSKFMSVYLLGNNSAIHNIDDCLKGVGCWRIFKMQPVRFLTFLSKYLLTPGFLGIPPALVKGKPSVEKKSLQSSVDAIAKHLKKEIFRGFGAFDWVSNTDPIISSKYSEVSFFFTLKIDPLPQKNRTL